MNKEEVKQLIEQVKTYSDLVKLKGTSKYSVNEVLEIANLVYPLIDEIIYDHPVKLKVDNSDKYLGFTLNIFNLVCNVLHKAEEIFKCPNYEIIEEYIYDCIEEELSSFTETINRENYTGYDLYKYYLVVKHKFYWGSRSDCWDNYDTDDKLDYLARYNSITTGNLLDELKEILFWCEVNEKFEELENTINSEEYAQAMIEDLKENYGEWFEEEVDYERDASYVS